MSAWMVRLQAQPIKPGHAFRVRFASHQVEIVHVTLAFPRQSSQASILDYLLDFTKFTLLCPIDGIKEPFELLLHGCICLISNCACNA